MVNVLMVGAGNLGRRHLQSLKNCENDLKIHVVEPYAQALELAESTYGAAELKGGDKQVGFYNSMDQVPSEIDVAVVATPATGRLEILDAVLSKGTQYVVLEKIAFNSDDDIERAKRLIEEKVKGAWVNCPRRMNPFYQALKERLRLEKIKQFEVVGENFGMACNAIHFIDLFSYLGGEKDYSISLEAVDQVLPSKREGYIEFFGQISGEFVEGGQFRLACLPSDSGVSFKVRVETTDHQYLIDEVNRRVEITNCHNAKREECDFRQPFQSELTGPLVDDILRIQSCALTGFDESMALHKPFINAAYNVFATSCGENEEKRVPIT